MAIINTINDLKKTVKVSNAAWDIYTIYLEDARDQYLVPYLGMPLVERLEASSDPEDAYLLRLAARVLGPFAVMLATDELSINTGDSGHTVSRTTTHAPASDAKIARAADSLRSRAWNNMERMLEYVEQHIERYPQWTESAYYKNRQTRYFASAAAFQDRGLVDIEYSRLTFEKLRQLILRIERTELRELIPADVEQKLFDDTATYQPVIDAAAAFVAARVAELHSSQTTKVQRTGSKLNVEYMPMIRPLYMDDSSNTLNFYKTQAAYYRTLIPTLLVESGMEIPTAKADWSNEGKRIFSAL